MSGSSHAQLLPLRRRINMCAHTVAHPAGTKSRRRNKSSIFRSSMADDTYPNRGPGCPIAHIGTRAGRQDTAANRGWRLARKEPDGDGPSANGHFLKPVGLGGCIDRGPIGFLGRVWVVPRCIWLEREATGVHPGILQSRVLRRCVTTTHGLTGFGGVLVSRDLVPIALRRIGCHRPLGFAIGGRK